MPARLAKIAGVWYDEFSNLVEDLPVTAPADTPLALEGRSPRGTRWADGLTLDGASLLAGYDHPHFGRWAAITTREAGSGRITYVGTVPNLDLAKALFAWACPAGRAGWQDLPDTVTATSATSQDGRRLRFVHNWSWTPAVVRLPVAASDVLNDHLYEPCDDLHLGSWDVHVLVEI
jgi:beta-galactosidase